MTDPLSIQPVTSAADRAAFIDVPYRLYASDPGFTPPLRSEVAGLLDRRKNPWFGHADAALWTARRGSDVVGRISAQHCRLVEQSMGPGTGQFGFFDCADDDEAAAGLFAAAEDWLRGRGLTRALGPFSLSIWDEPGLLVDGFDTKPLVMMGHHGRWLQQLVEARGYAKAKDLYAYILDIVPGFPERIDRIVSAGDKNSRIRLRRPDKARFAEEVTLILDILNEAWSDNWGYVPLTDAEVAYAAKKLKPVIIPDFVRICEYDGEAVGFMITLPDVNELTDDLDGRLLPLGWAKLLWRLRRPQTQRVRVPLMGVRKAFQSSRHGALMVFMMIEHIRRDVVANYGGKQGELSWILEDNLPMRNILESINSRIYKTYRIYEKSLV